MLTLKNKIIKISAAEALPGRKTPMTVSTTHFVTGNPMTNPFPLQLFEALFGLGCFWGAERKFWQQPGIFTTAVGYTGGYTPNPTYEEVCTGLTGHNEVVKVIFDPKIISYQKLLMVFWESHNPTQGMKQGNDVGTQYRSGIYTYHADQLELAEKSKTHYQAKLSQLGFNEISTEILQAPKFYFAENYHQQYLAKNPQGYCGIGGLGVPFE